MKNNFNVGWKKTSGDEQEITKSGVCQKIFVGGYSSSAVILRVEGTQDDGERFNILSN